MSTCGIDKTMAEPSLISADISSTKYIDFLGHKAMSVIFLKPVDALDLFWKIYKFIYKKLPLKSVLINLK